MKFQEYFLPNGRIYSVIDTEKPYLSKIGPYNATAIEEGGFIIRAKLSNGEYGYICHAEDQAGVNNFIRAAKRLGKPMEPIKEIEEGMKKLKGNSI